MMNASSFGSFTAQARELVTAVTKPVFTLVLERFPDLAQYLPQIFEACVLLLAVAALLLARRARRDRRALRGMAAELHAQQAELRKLATFCATLEEKIARSAGLAEEIAARQRSVEARVGKPDPRQAAAMARAGTAPAQMIDCGLSHSEVHLLRALASAA